MFPVFLCGKQNFLKKGPLSHLKPVNVCLPACVWKNGRNVFIFKWSPYFANGKWYSFVGSAEFLIRLHVGELCWETDEDIRNWSFCGRVSVYVYEDICSLKQFVVLGHVDCCCWHWQTGWVEFLKSGGRQKTIPSPLPYNSFPMTFHWNTELLRELDPRPGPFCREESALFLCSVHRNFLQRWFFFFFPSRFTFLFCKLAVPWVKVLPISDCVILDLGITVCLFTSWTVD